MTALLPPNLLRLFAPRPPLPYLAPVDKNPKFRRPVKYNGLAAYLDSSLDYDIDYVPTETMLEKNYRLQKEKEEGIKALAKSIKQSWDPTNLKDCTLDPYKTLFVANLTFDTTEKHLMSLMQEFGDIRRIKVIQDKKGKSKRYAFIEFERESAMKTAYKEANGVKLNGNRLLVDVERGRTVKGWTPKKLGGGLGKKRFGKEIKPRESLSSATRPDSSRRSFSGGRGASSMSHRGGDRDSHRGGDRDSHRGGDRDGYRGDRDGYRDGGGSYRGRDGAQRSASSSSYRRGGEYSSRSSYDRR